MRRKLLLLIASLLLFAAALWAATQGPNDGATFADDGGIGTLIWGTPANAQTSNNVLTVAEAFTGAALEKTHYLKATNFSFTLPGCVSISGITVEVEVSESIFNLAVVRDTAVRIVKGGAIGATDRSSGTRWTGTDTYLSHGGSSDLWGETWLCSDVTASTFGTAISATCTTSGNCSADAPQAQIDHIRITVTFTGPAEMQRRQIRYGGL